MSKRKKIPKIIETNVLLKSRRRCCACFFLNGDNDTHKGQIAHLDGNSSNYNEDNLAFLCLYHHDEYDSQTSQSKGITIEEIKQYRNQLYDTFQNAQHKNNDAEIERIVGKLMDRSYLVKGKSHTLLSIFLDTAKELASGCSLAYYGVLLQDYFGIQGTSGWAGLRKTLGFEASKIFGELIILGLWRHAPGTNQKEELYCLSDIGLEVAQRLDIEINHTPERSSSVERKGDYLKALLAELEYNKKLIDKNKIEGYYTSAFFNAKEANCLLDMPKNLRDKIIEAQTSIRAAQLRDNPHLYYSDRLDLKKLKKLSNYIIPKLRVYINNQ